jgi:hypothetical protein
VQLLRAVINHLRGTIHLWLKRGASRSWICWWVLASKILQAIDSMLVAPK